MKKLTSLAVLALATFSFSFKAVKAPPATTTTTNEVVPFSQVAFVPCAAGGAGEFVLIEGRLHILTHLTVNGNSFSVKTHFQPQGATGVGLTTGDKYNATGVTQEQQRGSFVNGSAEFTFINNFRIIGQGPDNNLLVHQNIHQTYNADGTLTSDVNNTSVECR